MLVKTHVTITLHNVTHYDRESFEYPLLVMFGPRLDDACKVKDFEFFDGVEDYLNQGGFPDPWATVTVTEYMDDNKDLAWREANFIRMVKERLGRDDIAVVFEWTPVEPIRRSVYHRPGGDHRSNVRQLKLDRYEEPITPW